MTEEHQHHDPSDDIGNEPEKLEDNLTARGTWLRLLFMVLVAIIYGIAEIVMTAVVLLQFFWVLFTGRTNERLLGLGSSLASFSRQVVRYLTYNSDARPFPFDLDWPNAEPPAD